MTEQTRFDRVLPGLFDELAAARTPDYLEAAIERASSGPQRPSWTFPGRWLPMDITTRTAPVARMPWRQLGVLALIGLLLAVALAAYVGSQRRQRPAPPFGPAANGAVAFASDGDIFVADRPGGDVRALMGGPEDDSSPMFSPDGTRLAFMRSIDAQHDDGALMIADADGTNVVQVATEASLGAESRSGWRFAPDGRSFMTVAQIGGEKRLVIRPVDPAAALTVLDIPPLGGWWEIEDPSFRPTNPQEILVVARLEADGGQGLYVYDLATGGIRTIVEPADGQYVQDVAWLPDGKHIIYGPPPHIVAADGSSDQAFDAVRGRVSPLSNDGTRIVAERDGEDQQIPRQVIVPINGDGEPVVLACGPKTDIANQREPRPDVECPTDWIWSPDDTMLIGTLYPETWISGEAVFAETYLLVDAHTGQVTELDWRDVGTPAWQRVAP
jgi:dipeptidyl aminopeptidase/acylaminoacyl peptidase